MPHIQQLSPHVADLIAAGEVVERPASVVKELLENALDAGATAIVAEVQHGGLTYLRMTDNGCGIAPQQLPTAFLRHATSKLRTAGDLAAIGTVADVMQMSDENRTIVSRGLASISRSDFIGLHALLHEAGLSDKTVTSVQIGFILAPRINAAGRMGQINLAVELFLTDDPDKAAEAARGLCELNRQRQAVESEIYRQAVSMLPMGKPPEAIVLADESWHQGVVGIVASRIAEELSLIHI